MAKPQVGDAAPDFVQPWTGEGDFRLSEHRGRWVVLAFYPGDETHTCTRQLCEYRDAGEALTGLDAEIVGRTHVTKEAGGELRYAGQLEVSHGRYKLQGKRFELDRGVAVFTGGTSPIPDIDIEAHRRASREVTVYAHVRGPADAPIHPVDEVVMMTGRAPHQPPESFATPVVARDGLQPGDAIKGPAIIAERTTTVVIEPGWQAALTAICSHCSSGISPV